jgi:hypothetical protein
MAKKKVKVAGKHTTLTYVILFHGANQSYKQAKENVEGSLFNCLSAQLLSAFTLEAFLNHVGQKNIKLWNILEKKLQPAEKLEFICNEICFKPDFSRRPFQYLKQIFGFRNYMVHGKTETETVEEIQLLSDDEKIKRPKLYLDKNCNMLIAERTLQDTKDIIEIISNTLGEEHPFSLMGHGFLSKNNQA